MLLQSYKYVYRLIRMIGSIHYRVTFLSICQINVAVLFLGLVSPIHECYVDELSLDCPTAAEEVHKYLNVLYEPFVTLLPDFQNLFSKRTEIACTFRIRPTKQ